MIRFEAVVHHKSVTGTEPAEPAPVNPGKSQPEEADRSSNKAHLHAPAPKRESASAPIHSPNEGLIKNEDRISVGAPPSTSTLVPPQSNFAIENEAAGGEEVRSTHFLALDRCLPGQPYMHVCSRSSCVAISFFMN